MVVPTDAYAVRKCLTGQRLNGEVDHVSKLVRPILEFMETLRVDQRMIAWEARLAGRDDRDEWIRALAEVDLSAPPPEAEEAFRFATLADVRRLQAETRWVWEGFIPSSRIVGLAAFEGTGKTRLAADWARRIHRREPWPDGQAPTFPAGTRTIWMCSDAHQDELPEIMSAFDVPDEAIVFPTSSEDPYGGTDLDNPETMANLERCIVEVKPGLVFVDTLTSATSVDLCDQRSMKPLKAKLAPLVQTYQVPIILQLHLSREGQALGRRIKGLTRTLMHLECPDPEHPERLRFWVEKSYSKRPPAMGVTMTDSGNQYDFNPPSAPEAPRAGRKPEARDKAAQFIRDALTKANDQIGNTLLVEWEKAGGNYRTFWRAVDDLVETEELSTEGGKGTGKQKLLHLNSLVPDEAKEPGNF